MKTPLIYIALFCLIDSGCRKEPLPKTVEEEPVFFVSCKVEQAPVKIVAGDNDYEMVSGYHQDSNGVYVLSASLQKKNCTNCYALTVLMNDHMVAGVNGPLHIDSALHQGVYQFNENTSATPDYMIDLIPHEKQDPTGTYTWIIRQDGEPAFEKKAYQCYIHARSGKTYTVTLLYEDASGCSASHTAVLKPGSEIPVTINAINSGGNLTYNFSASGGGDPASYYWEFGDGSTSWESNPVHDFADLGGGHYNTTLTVTYSDNTKSQAFYQVPGTTGSVCLANFNAIGKPEDSALGLSTITIELRDPSGQVYSTREFDQPGNSSFEVVSVEDYRNNEKGQPTKLFRIKFNCLVKNGAQELAITEGEAVMAVAYQ